MYWGSAIGMETNRPSRENFIRILGLRLQRLILLVNTTIPDLLGNS